MKKYIKITNSGTTPREFLKVIGAGDNKSDKPDDNSIFGQFRSGYKIASIIALRRGLRIVASSTDDEGRYSLEYIVREKIINHNGKKIIIPKIFYLHCDDSKSWVEESSFSLDAFPKWAEAVGDDENNLYPILRELIANARDEDKEFCYEANVGSIKLAAPGQTIVYIEQTDDAIRILNEHAERYFKFLDFLPIYEVPGIGAIYEKSVPDETRLFNCGYLISCQKDDRVSRLSSFDYDVSGKDFISEERVLRDKDRGKYDKQLARLFLSIRNKDLLNYIINAATNSVSYELQIIRFANIAGDFPPDFAALCREIWVEKFGTKAILSCDNADNNKEAKNLLHYEVISLLNSLRILFKKAGVEDAGQKILSFNRGLTERPPNAGEQEKIDRVKKAYLDNNEYYRSLAETYPVTILMDISGSAVGIAFDYKRCAIAESEFAKSDTEFLLTWVHELRHCATKLHDTNYRELMYRADREIIVLLKNAAENIKEIELLKETVKKLEEYMESLGAVKVESDMSYDDIVIEVEEEITKK